MAFETKEEAARAGSTAPLENRTLWQRVHEFLREEILADRLPPGTELQEAALAASLGVSRGPVREALGRLSAEGLVMIRPRNGAVVRSFSRDEFIEAYQVREALETFALRLAVPRITNEELSALDDLLDRMVEQAEAEDAHSFFNTNAAFHEAMVEASGNRRLDEMHRQLLRQLGRYHMRSLALRGNLQESIDEHRAIVRAIRARDVELAIALLAEHIHIPLRRLESASQKELVELGMAEAEPRKEARV
jgi:DNA-binding GntR family transcriptional regulator